MHIIIAKIFQLTDTFTDIPKYSKTANPTSRTGLGSYICDQTRPFIFQQKALKVKCAPQEIHTHGLNVTNRASELSNNGPSDQKNSQVLMTTQRKVTNSHSHANLVSLFNKCNTVAPFLASSPLFICTGMCNG